MPDDCWEEVVGKLIPVMQDTDPDGQPNHPPVIPIPTRYAAAEILDRLHWLPKDLDAFVWIDSPSPAGRGRGPGGEGGFYIAKYPVTNHQFARFVDAGGYQEPEYWGGEESDAWRWRMEKHNVDWRGEGPVTQPEYWDHPRLGKSRRGYPVVGVSWYEAMAYCRWFAEQLHASRFTFQVWRDGKLETLNLKPATITVRLPTEEEWIAAAGGAEGDRFPWGNEWDESCANTAEGGIGGTTPVGMYPSGKSDPYGVWDMAGNVWEWTTSWVGEWQAYALRGGSWFNLQGRARVLERSRSNPDYSDSGIGFRVVASPAGSGY